MLAIVLAVIFLLVMALKLGQIEARPKKAAPGKAPPSSQPPPPGRFRLFFRSLKSVFTPHPRTAKTTVSAKTTPTPRSGAELFRIEPATERRDPSPTPSFDEHLFRHNVEAELQTLRAEVAELREALGRLQASRSVSPQYTEAMRLAQRGATARSIADECAISIGEAELVRALSQNNLEHPDDDGQYDEHHWER